MRAWTSLTQREERDPRTMMELRRLALRAKRSSEAREVLHDALMMTFLVPYERIIEDAHRLDKITKREHLVVFYPSRMGRYEVTTGRTYSKEAWGREERLWYKRKPSSPDVLFGLETGLPRASASRLSTNELEEWFMRTIAFGNAVIVYRTRGYL